MNLTVEKPTDTIKISLSGFKACSNMDSNINSINQKFKGIDFYRFQEKKFFYSKFDDIDFLIHCISFDIRVKEYRKIDDCLFVFFAFIDDSISFYKHYWNRITMKFVYLLDFQKTSIFYEQILKKKILLPKVEDNDINICDNQDIEMNEYIKRDEYIEMNEYNSIHNSIQNNFTDFYKNSSFSNSFSFFQSRIDYFNGMKNFYSKNDIKKLNYQSIFFNSKELSVGAFSNVFVQNAVSKMDQLDLIRFINSLSYDISPISATKHGAYTIQRVLEAAKSLESQKLICKYFSKTGQFLISHEIGNYSIQKISEFDEDLFCTLTISNLEQIVNEDLGFKILQKSILHFSKFKLEFLEKLKKCKIWKIEREKVLIGLFKKI